MRAVAAELQKLSGGGEHKLLLVQASFAAASLISIVGAGLAPTSFHVASHLTVALAFIVGFVGVGGILTACTHLFRDKAFAAEHLRRGSVNPQPRGGAAAPAVAQLR